MRSRALRVLCLAVLCGGAAPARAFVQYESDAGWSFSFNQGSFHDLVQVHTPPAVIDSGGDFSFNGALCPLPIPTSSTPGIRRIA